MYSAFIGEPFRVCTEVTQGYPENKLFCVKNGNGLKAEVVGAARPYAVSAFKIVTLVATLQNA